MFPNFVGWNKQWLSLISCQKWAVIGFVIVFWSDLTPVISDGLEKFLLSFGFTCLPQIWTRLPPLWAFLIMVSIMDWIANEVTGALVKIINTSGSPIPLFLKLTLTLRLWLGSDSKVWSLEQQHLKPKSTLYCFTSLSL